MGQWVDYWKVIEPVSTVKKMNTTNTLEVDVSGAGVFSNYSWYQDLMLTAKSRLQKYDIYDSMDNDVDVTRALDTIAEEMTGDDEDTGLPFEIEFFNYDEQTVQKRDVITVKAALRNWCKKHDISRMKYAIARNTIKKGDTIFKKTGNHKKWIPVPVQNILGIEIDENGFPKNYHIKGKEIGDGYNKKQEVEIIPVEGIIHFSNDETSVIDNNPFGTSVLDSVIKTYKQKNLLEDSVIIYRVVRAPERRVFYIDVGGMPPPKAKKYMEQVKAEINQKRVPTTQDGQDTVDSVYNPTSMGEDYFFGTTANGRGSRVETLPGGQGLGENSDLEFFQKKLFRGLRIPSSYMTGAEAGGAQFNDGKVGIAYIEEMRFANFVKRLQRNIEIIFDQEFKLYMRNSGINIDGEIFELRLPDPQNFALYRQSALDAELINTFTAADGIKYMSKRMILRKYLGWSEDDIHTNETLLEMERAIVNHEDDELSESDLSIEQQIYDPDYYENREAVSMTTSVENSDDDLEDDLGDIDIDDEPPAEPEDNVEP